MDFVQILISSVLSLAVLFILAKLMGNKQVSQLSLFDYIVGISIGSIAAEAATELEEPMQPFAAMVIYGIIAFLVSLLSEKSLSVRKIMIGKPCILMDNGHLYRENMKKCRIDVSDFLMQCRNAGYFDLNKIQTAVMEYSGAISFLPTEPDRPATPNDMNLSPKQEYIQTAVIMDGHINAANLAYAGKNEVWLARELHNQGYSNAKEVLLAMCDRDNKLTVFAMNENKH